MLNQKRILSAFLFVIIILVIGCQDSDANQEKKLNFDDQLISEETVLSYLESHLLETNFGGKVTCAYQSAGADEIKGKITLYIAAQCMEGASSSEGAGINVPVALFIEKKQSEYIIVSHKYPRDGNLYYGDYKQIFPEETQKKLDSISGEDLEEQVMKRASQKR